MRKNNFSINHSHPIHAYSRKTGSAAIILSLMVSGAVLSTIIHSQKSIDWFISNTEQSKEGWQSHLAVKYGFTLGGYLVANNLILCKEEGWQGRSTLCKWNTSDTTVQLSDYHLEQPRVTTVDGRDVLTFEGGVEEPTLNNGEAIDYTISFDLVNWKDPNIRGLIGEMPKYTCRNTHTLEVMSGICSSPSQTQCKDSNNNLIPDSVCEYIEDVDQDFYIVLMAVKLVGQKDQVQFAGIRRPLAHVTTLLESSPNCNLACAASDTSQSYPECRGEFTPPTGREDAILRLKIINHGPGAVYALSLLKTKTSKVNMERDNQGNLVRDANGDPIPVKTYGVTDDLVKQAAGGEVLLPGKMYSFIFEDRVSCLEEVTYRHGISLSFNKALREGYVSSSPSLNPGVISRSLIQNFSTIRSVNMHAEPFMSLDYGVGSLLSPIGICVAGFDAYGNRQQIKGKCINQYSVGQSCGSGGTCLYPHIEPRKLFFPRKNAIDLDYINTHIGLTTDVLAY